jgi:hypothetical protein
MREAMAGKRDKSRIKGKKRLLCREGKVQPPSVQDVGYAVTQGEFKGSFAKRGSRLLGGIRDAVREVCCCERELKHSGIRDL